MVFGDEPEWFVPIYLTFPRKQMLLLISCSKMDVGFDLLAN